MSSLVKIAKIAPSASFVYQFLVFFIWKPAVSIGQLSSLETWACFWQPENFERALHFCNVNAVCRFKRNHLSYLHRFLLINQKVCTFQRIFTPRNFRMEFSDTCLQGFSCVNKLFNALDLIVKLFIINIVKLYAIHRRRRMDFQRKKTSPQFQRACSRRTPKTSECKK